MGDKSGLYGGKESKERAKCPLRAFTRTERRNYRLEVAATVSVFRREKASRCGRLALKNDGTTFEKTFDLKGSLDNLTQIDEAVEQFKNEALPEIENALLSRAQEKAIANEKKCPEPAMAMI